jgi:hypothetical protein
VETIVSDLQPITSVDDDVTFLKLAREVAMDMRPLPQILETYKIDDARWQRIRTHPRFISYLDSAVAEWASPKNTAERVRVKAAIMVEEWLPEAHARMYDRTEALPAKTELGKLIAKLAGVGERAAGSEAGEKVSITINLGGESIRVEKDITPRVIEHED